MSACRSDPVLLTGLQLLGGFGEDAKEAGGVEMTENIFNKLEELDWLEFILTTETTQG